MVFFLFFLALDLFSSQLRDVWDEGVSKSINSNEKTALKLQIRAAKPKITVRHFKIAVRNFCIFSRTNQRAFAVRNFCMGMLLT
jgi:hypothetical protein